MIRAGLFLYDHLGHGIPGFGPKSTLPPSKGIRLDADGYGAGLKPEFERGFVYYDCWVDDARMVVLNARSAAALGATILTRTRLQSAKRENGRWVAKLRDESGEARTVHAQALVNAAGPWVRQVLDEVLRIKLPASVRLVKGSHIVVPRIHAGRHAFILQNPDRRVIFMIPYERQFTLVGTTDIPVTRDDFRAKITRKEIEYLCEAASRYSQMPITPGMVVWSYSGVRPLYDDGTDNPSAVTRDYHLLLDKGAWPDDPPLVSVFGGKITTYRRLAEQVMVKLADKFPGKAAWTHTEALPGGELNGLTFRGLLLDYRRRFPRLPKIWLTRVLRRHGSLAEEIIGDAHLERDLGRYFGGGLYEREVDYLVRNEWAREADDVLWRRTKCGLHMSADEKSAVREYLATR
jgi:glycerol-3-phosphate dehydrogenase